MDHSPPSAPRLSVSVVMYNSSVDLLRRTLNSVRDSSQDAAAQGLLGQVDINVVDNSSDPGCRERTAREVSAWEQSDFLRVRYTGSPENRGFGAGHNVALESVESDYHLVLNPDAELGSDALRVGLTTLGRDQAVALVTPRVLAEDGAQEFLCKRYPSVLVLLLRAFAPRFVRRLFRRRLYRYEMRDACSGPDQVDVMLASGCYMLARTAALKAVGGFNELYFLYFEDFDLSIRLGSQGRAVFIPDMSIVHHGGYAASKGLHHVWLFIKSGIRFFNDHGWRWI